MQFVYYLPSLPECEPSEDKGLALFTFRSQGIEQSLRHNSINGMQMGVAAAVTVTKSLPGSAPTAQCREPAAVAVTEVAHTV